MYQLLDLFRGDVFARPRVFPARLGGSSRLAAIVGVPAGLGGRARPILGLEDVLEERHGESGAGSLGSSPAACVAGKLYDDGDRACGGRADAGTERVEGLRKRCGRGAEGLWLLSKTRSNC